MGKDANGFEFRRFATPRIIGGIAIAVIVLWALSIIFTSPEGPSSRGITAKGHSTATADTAAQAAPAVHGAGAAGSHDAPVGKTSSDSLETVAHDTSAAAGQGRRRRRRR